MDDLDDRSSFVKIGGKEYRLSLTTRALKEIAKRYGGLNNLGEKLMSPENFEMAVEETVRLIVLLANQPILLHNLRNWDKPEKLLTEDEVELLTSPADFIGFKDAVTDAISKGMARNVESEDTPKNTLPE